MKKNSKHKRIEKPNRSVKPSGVPKTKEAFKTQIYFHFKDLKNPTIEYAAHYVSRGITGEWFSIQILGSSTNFYQDEAWTIFRENATFDDIFKGLRPYDIHDIAHSGVPNFMDYQKWTDRKMLKELSLHPEWLAYDTGATTRLIFLLKTAQVANSDKAREAKENLDQCLIPKRPGSLKSYPENFKEALFLSEKLSKYISSKCRRFLRDGEGAITNEYVELQEWGKTEEPRIVSESLDSLSFLVRDPVPFAEKKLAQELYVSVGSLKAALYK